MPMEAPFDVWDGEELGLTDEVTETAAEEEAMHLDPESEVAADGGPHWSDLTEGDGAAERTAPVCYFADEDPEVGNGHGAAADDHVPDLGELLVRQHYMA
jgi:hypothetical protein